MVLLCSAIADFLELEGSEERSQGWMLLSTLNLLAAEGNTLVEVFYSSVVNKKKLSSWNVGFD